MECGWFLVGYGWFLVGDLKYSGFYFVILRQ